MSRIDSIRADAPFAVVGRLRGIPPLRGVVLPEGAREIRIADWYSMIAGTPVPMLRVGQQDGQVWGEVLFFWEATHARRSRATTACEPRTKKLPHCVYVVPPERAPDWGVVAARLDSLGAWTLKEECEDHGYISDSGELMLQRLMGPRFEQYNCNAPLSRTRSVAGRRAAALYSYFLALIAELEPPA